MNSKPVFRTRIYRVDPSRLSAFTDYFLTYLLPVQERHGAQLVGRWCSADATQVIAVWMYKTEEEMQRIQGAVRDDPASDEAQAVRDASQPFYLSFEELTLTSTVDLSRTLLGRDFASRPATSDS